MKGRARYQNNYTGDWYVLQQGGTYRLTDDGKTGSSWCSGPGEWRGLTLALTLTLTLTTNSRVNVRACDSFRCVNRSDDLQVAYRRL